MENERLIEMAQQSAIKQPKCPGCKHAPLEFLCNVAQTGAGHQIAVIWCGKCGYTLQTQFVGIDQPRVSTPAIIRPS